MTDEEIREQKRQICQQYGITDEQLAAIGAAICKLWEAVKEIAENIVEYFRENAAAFQETMKEFDASTLSELIEKIQGAIEKQQPPTYNRKDTRNAQYNARLKGYKNKYMRSAAIMAPKRTARSCC